MNKTNEKTNALRALEFERVKEKDDEKKDRTKKWIHESVQQMIFNTMLEDGERPATDYTEPFKTIFNSDSTGAAMKQMAYELLKQGCEGVNICEGAMNAIYHGDLLTSKEK
jgi:hypothetical protein